MVAGVARLRWGDKLEFVAEAGQGDFTFRRSCRTREINAQDDVQLQCVLARSRQGLVYNLDIDAVETPELIRWIDDLHS